MSGARSFYFRESLDSLLRTRWVGPYLLVPPMLAFMVYAEGYLSANGITGVFNLEQRTVLAVWNATLLLTLIAGVISCLYFSGLWGSRWFRQSLALPVRRASGFWGPYLSVLLVTSVMYAMATGAVVTALPEVDGFPWVQVLAGSFVPIFWAVSAGAMLGLLTTGAGAAFLFVTVLLVGFVSGLPVPYSPPDWFVVAVPPVGKVMSESLSYPQGLIFAALLATHGVGALVFGRLLYGAGVRRV